MNVQSECHEIFKKNTSLARCLGNVHLMCSSCNVLPTTVSTNDEYRIRNRIKSITFGLRYGVSSSRLSLSIPVQANDEALKNVDYAELERRVSQHSTVLHRPGSGTRSSSSVQSGTDSKPES